jgi:hypothetical protein
VTFVVIHQAPNQTIAESLCEMLGENGIEAFHKDDGFNMTAYGGSNEFSPASIWVDDTDEQKAKELISQSME